MQVFQMLIYPGRIGQRPIDIVEVTHNELCPIDELVKLLGPVTHRQTVSVIKSKHHLDVGSCYCSRQFGDKVIDGCHTGHEMGHRHTLALITGDQYLLQVVGKELTTAPVRKHKAVILKTLRVHIMLCHLLQECCHIMSFRSLVLLTSHHSKPIA